MKVVILSESGKRKARTPASPHNSLPFQLEHELLKRVGRSNRFLPQPLPWPLGGWLGSLNMNVVAPSFKEPSLLVPCLSVCLS